MKAVHTCVSFSNVKLVRTFENFIYFAFSASAEGSTPLQEANRGMPLDGVSFSRLEGLYNGDAFSIDLLE